MGKGQAFTTNVFDPSACDASTLSEFQALVLAGGEVDPTTLPNLIQRALVLGFAHLGASLVGVSGIKRPNDSYRSKVFMKAKSPLNPSKFEFELGWVYVNPCARGNRLASRLVLDLMPALKGAAVYATSRVDNWPMHSSLHRAGFRLEGTPYPSNMNEPDIQLFVCG
jgi:hypothetical protein